MYKKVSVCIQYKYVCIFIMTKKLFVQQPVEKINMKMRREKVNK